MFYDLLIFIFMSYIKPQLIITTARCQLSYISYYSYIKPQLFPIKDKTNGVVYRTIPTSNHNLMASGDTKCLLYIVLFLHQTTTLGRLTEIKRWLYIILFLHQTTTWCTCNYWWCCCISYYSYIKPQHYHGCLWTDSVVYHTIPTSNHNTMTVYIHDYKLYIILFLHQTTTWILCGRVAKRCISYYSYIKPQLENLSYHLLTVVYHTIPTSNHNSECWVLFCSLLYIILFLHQTTTWKR